MYLMFLSGTVAPVAGSSETGGFSAQELCQSKETKFQIIQF
jgi:hypothetical protein